MRQENTVFPLNMETNSHLAKAWENFTGSGVISSSNVRSVISKSWIKSRALGIRPETERAPTVISKDEIEEKVRNEDLGRAGISVLNELSDVLKDSQHVVVLADARGRILYSIGHQEIQDKLERINFRPGGAWSEQVAGPNGVGTPLALGHPEIVMGYEHYCKGWHPWVCYGAPVHDAIRKNIMGSVDITGPVKNINKQAMALAISVAHSVQSGLSLVQFHRREVLRDLGRKLLQRWASDGIIIMDEYGFIVEYNSKAIRYMNLQPTMFFNYPVSQLMPGISEPVYNCIEKKQQMEINIHTERQSGFLQPVKICIEPIMQANKCLGAAMVLTEVYKSTQSIAIPEKNNEPISVNENNDCESLRAIGDNLIKHTLEQTGNNVSKAARILGINRTTIYRRRRNW